MRKPTLEQLEGEVWPEPEFDSKLTATCHQLRKKPIEEFSNEDLQFLLPKAIGILEDEPLSQGDYYPGDLLKTVICADSSFYARSPGLLARVVSVSQAAVDRLRSSPDDADLLSALRRFVEDHAV